MSRGGVTLVQELVLTGRVTPAQGATLLELRRRVKQSRRGRLWRWVLGFLIFLGACKTSETAPRCPVPADAGVDATSWRTVFICKDVVVCRVVDELSLCSAKDPSCLVIPIAPVDAGTDGSPYLEAPAP